MNEIKIRSDNRVSVGANIKRIRISKGVRAFDTGFTITGIHAKQTKIL